MSDSLFEPPDWLEREEEVLASYAMHTRASRGRHHPEPPHTFRTLYQRDRDRIVHSTAFRRLMHKTQVLVNPGGDYHRTRLTHTLEVAQIARTIARQLACPRAWARRGPERSAGARPRSRPSAVWTRRRKRTGRVHGHRRRL